MPEDEYTGATLTAMIVVPLLIILLIAAAVTLLIVRSRRHRHDRDRTLFLGAGVVCGVAAAIAATGLWWGMYPWKAEYHEWRPVAGVIATADSRLVPAGENTMQDKFVVTFEGDPREYGVLDTRAASARPGDRLVITCVRRWQWSGAHGLDCNFVDLERNPDREGTQP